MTKPAPARLYLVDDDKNTRRSLQVALEGAGYLVHTAAEPLRALPEILRGEVDVLIFDIRLGEISGLELFKRLRSEGFRRPTIFMSGHASLSEAVEAVNLGAFDFLEKPFAPEKLRLAVERALEMQDLRERIERYERQAVVSDFLGQSPSFLNVRREIAKVAATLSPVLITGESGTGKELIAREVHAASRQRAGPFVKVNCSAVPENLFESEFFGHEKGAFTGAQGARKGYFESAHQGTLLLDEIGDMPLGAQAKILRALQNAEIQKLGSERVTPVQVRVMASTHRDLTAAVKRGEFREDLFYRLNVFPIEAPALRERSEDIPLLVNHFLQDYCRTNGFARKLIDVRALRLLMDYRWPGNIRELKNVVERLAILSGQTLTENDVPDFVHEATATVAGEVGLTLKEFRARTEREYIVRTLTATKGNVSEAAQRLAIERTYLHKKILDYAIGKREFFV